LTKTTVKKIWTLTMRLLKSRGFSYKFQIKRRISNSMTGMRSSTTYTTKIMENLTTPFLEMRAALSARNLLKLSKLLRQWSVVTTLTTP